MPDVSFRDIQKGLRELGLTSSSRVIAHASLSAFGLVRGGAETVVGALTSFCPLVVMPAFTYQCTVWPLVGPPDNAATYGGHEEENANAEIFRADLPVHPSLGIVAETLRQMRGAIRSTHPLASFVAVGAEAEAVLASQSLVEPLGPIAYLEEAKGDVLLLGVNHTANTSIHYAEARAGRKRFTRWALTRQSIVECPAVSGCSEGFEAIAEHIQAFTRSTQIGAARVQRIPLVELLHTAEELIRSDPAALLCNRPDCERCNAIRMSLAPALAG
jgi:aminoglycoside 3-N-acetyltransferase